MKKRTLGLALALLMLLSLSACKPEKSLESDLHSILGRDSQNGAPDGPGDGSWTVLVYLIGSDLESQAGHASMDILEMFESEYSPKVRLVIQTGGALDWKLDHITSGQVERHLRTGPDDITLVDTLRGNPAMTDPATLTEFIRFGVKAQPADHYALILWDHGGGTLGGYGLDEFYPEQTMDVPSLNAALDQSGVRFDFIGFDACLMGTLEVAYTLRDNADYLIASAQLEPGTGWSYTGWMSALAMDPAISPEALGKIIVDDYITDCHALDYPAEGVLAVIDLHEIDGVYRAMSDFLAETGEMMDGTEYMTVAQARAGARDYGGTYEQIDLAQFAWLSGARQAQAVQDALDEAMVYVKRTDNLAESCGLALYYPFQYPELVGPMLEQLDAIGIGGAYTDAMTRFASGLLANQLSAGSVTYDWYQEPQSLPSPNPLWDTLSLVEVNGRTVIPMSPEDWGLVYQYEDVLCRVEQDLALPLGATIPMLDEWGNIIVEEPNSWWSIGGRSVAYFIEGVYYGPVPTYYGMVYATLEKNGEWHEIDLMIYTEGRHSYIAGYRIPKNICQLAERGLRQLEDGDRLYFQTAYRGPDGTIKVERDATPLTVGIDGLAVEMLPLPPGEYVHWIAIRDIYNNQHIAPQVLFER